MNLKNNMVLVKFKVVDTFQESYIHDFRVKKPDYLCNFYYHNKYKNLFTGNAEEIKELLDMYKLKHIQYHKNKYGEKNKSRKAVKSNLSGLIGISHSIVQDLKDEKVTHNKLVELFNDALDKILNKIRAINPSVLFGYAALHFDEKTPHLHFVCCNFDENCKSIFHQIRNSKNFFSECQDIVGEVFSEIGYQRGEKREWQSILKIREMHIKESKSYKDDIQNLKLQIQDLEKELELKRVNIESSEQNLKILQKKEIELIEKNKNLAYKSLEELKNLINYYENNEEDDLLLRR